MTSTEDKLARELGFRVCCGFVEYPDQPGKSYVPANGDLEKLWRKCLELTRERDAERKEYEKEIDRLQSVCVLAEKERDALAKPVNGMSDSNYETGQTLWREWFESGGRTAPQCPTDTGLMLTWIVAKFRAALAGLKGERDAS